jgi:hypothetical protein
VQFTVTLFSRQIRVCMHFRGYLHILDNKLNKRLSLERWMFAKEFIHLDCSDALARAASITMISIKIENKFSNVVPLSQTRRLIVCHINHLPSTDILQIVRIPFRVLTADTTCQPVRYNVCCFPHLRRDKSRSNTGLCWKNFRFQ